MPFYDAHSIRESLVIDRNVMVPGKLEDITVGPEPRTLEVDFADCESIVFWDGPTRVSEKYLLHTAGTGRVSLPAGVQMQVTSGKVLLRQAPARQSAGASVVAANYGGARAGSASPRSSQDSPSRGGVVDDWVVQEEHPDANKMYGQVMRR